MNKADMAHKDMSFTSLCKMFASVYNYCREFSGDNAYDKYLMHTKKNHPNDLVLSPKEFYKQEIDRKWNGIRRCC